MWKRLLLLLKKEKINIHQEPTTSIPLGSSFSFLVPPVYFTCSLALSSKECVCITQTISPLSWMICKCSQLSKGFLISSLSSCAKYLALIAWQFCCKFVKFFPPHSTIKTVILFLIFFYFGNIVKSREHCSEYLTPMLLFLHSWSSSTMCSRGKLPLLIASN